MNPLDGYFEFFNTFEITKICILFGIRLGKVDDDIRGWRALLATPYVFCYGFEMLWILGLCHVVLSHCSGSLQRLADSIHHELASYARLRSILIFLIGRVNVC